MKRTVPISYYSHYSLVFIALVVLFYVLYIGQNIILPIIFATIISILLNPVVNFLLRKRFNKIVAITLAISIAVILLGSLIYFIASQLSMFTESLPILRKKINAIFTDVIAWISVTFNISAPRIEAWVDETKNEGLGGTEVIEQTIGTIGGVLTISLLMPVYIFMLLFYKNMLLEFIRMIFPNQRSSVAEILADVKVLIQSYLVGLMIEAAIVATLLSTGLLIMGVDYAVLLGLMGAMLNLIPYIGNIIGTVLPSIVALTTKPPVYILFIIGLYAFVQFIDNNLIVPKIVASKVEINALVSIIIVVVGGALCGVPGMFLAIPLTAIMKVIFDRVEPLKPIGFLLGDNLPDEKKRVKTKINTHP
jgi:predicted PurR-regulated permease PerM